jgi:hypothetical protein
MAHDDARLAYSCVIGAANAKVVHAESAPMRGTLDVRAQPDRRPGAGHGNAECKGHCAQIVFRGRCTSALMCDASLPGPPGWSAMSARPGSIDHQPASTAVIRAGSTRDARSGPAASHGTGMRPCPCRATAMPGGSVAEGESARPRPGAMTVEASAGRSRASLSGCLVPGCVQLSCGTSARGCDNCAKGDSDGCCG